MAIESGEASVVVSYYAINLSERGAGGAYAVHAGDRAKAAFEMPFGYYGQPVYFAAAAARYRHLYGLEPEQLGAIALAARAHAQQTPNALRREPLDMAGYLDNPMVAEPLRKLDCCLVNDGGVAFVMTSLERARDLPRRPAVVAGVGFGSKPVPQSGYFSQSERPADDRGRVLRRRGRTARPASRRPTSTSPRSTTASRSRCCLQLEDLGFAPKGDGAEFVGVGRHRARAASCP